MCQKSLSMCVPIKANINYDDDGGGNVAIRYILPVHHSPQYR